MLSGDKTSKKSRKVKFNLNNNTLTSFPDQEQNSTSISPNNISLIINSSLSRINKNIEIDTPKEKELLLSQVKSKNRFNTTSRFAVLTNIRLCIYYSKDNYIKDKQNPYKVFILNDHKFELEKKILIIKRISNNKNKYITVKKYEFNSLELAIKWWETIIASITWLDLKYNQYLKEYYNKKIYEEVSENNSNNLSNHIQSELRSDVTSEFIGDAIKDKNNEENTKDKNWNENNKNLNVDKNRKSFEINNNINIENNKNQSEEQEITYNEKSKLKINKEEGNNKNLIEDADFEENINVNKSKFNNETYSSIYSKLYCNEDAEDDESNNDLQIKNKPSFRFLLKEVINKIENELENNITNDNIDNSIDNHNNINKNKDMDKGNSLKDDELGKKYSYILSSVNNNNKNIYSFGKQSNLNSFNSNNALKKKEKPMDVDKFRNEISGNDIEIKELSESNTNELESEKTNDNNIFGKTKNKKNSKKNSSKNLEVNTNSSSKNNSRRNFDIIKLKSCEKDNTINSEINFDLSNSYKNCKKSEKDNSSNNLNQKGDFLENNEQKNKIRSFIMNNNSNENQNLDKKDEKNDNISFDSKSNISCFCDNLNSSKNLDKILNTMKEANNDLDKTSNKSVSQTYKNYLKKIEEENANYLNNNDYRDDDSNSQRTILYSENTNKTNCAENSQIDKKSILDKSDDPFKSINNIKMFDSQSQSKEDNLNISKINLNSGNNSLNSIKAENIKNPAEIDISSLYNTNINQNSSFSEANQNISVHKISEKEECSLAFSNDIYTDIHEQKKSKSKGRVDDNHRNKNDNNSIFNDKSLNISLNSKNDNNEDIAHSILLIDKNNPLLINSSKYENNNNKAVDSNNLLNESSNINNRNIANIQEEFDNKDNSNKMHKQNKPPKCKYNSVNFHKMNKFNNYNGASEDNQVNFNVVGEQNERRTAKDNNNILKNIISKNHFEFSYSPNNLKNWINNSFLSVKNKNSFNFQVQNAINFNIDSIRNESKNNYYHFEISKDSFPINIKNKNEDNAIKKTKNISDKNKNYKCKNKSLDMLNQNNYNNGFNDIKTHKNFLCKNMLKKDLLKDCSSLSKIENCEKKNEFEIKHICDDLDEFSSNEEFITKSGRKIDDLSQRINYKNKNDKQYNNNLLICNLIKNTFDENMSKYPNKIKNDKYIISKKIYKEVNNNEDKSKNNSSRYLSTIESICDKNSTQSYTFIEKSFKLVENNEKRKNEKGKITPSKLIENILIHRYSKQMLLYCYNNGMSTTTFIPKLEENLDKILKNNEKSDITLKYLFQNIPDIIRKRLQKDDLKLIFRPNNPENDLSDFGDDSKSYKDYIGVDDEYNSSKDGIKKLILNDNKLVVKILNKYYDNIYSIDNKNELLNYKKNFIQEMKKLNSEILLL